MPKYQLSQSSSTRSLKRRRSSSAVASRMRPGKWGSINKYSRSALPAVYRSIAQKVHPVLISTQPFIMTFNSGLGNGGIGYYTIPVAAGTLPPAGPGGNYAGLSFSLNGVYIVTTGAASALVSTNTNVAEYTSLFDEFILDRVVLRFVFSSNQVAQGQSVVIATAQQLGPVNLLTAIDYDDTKVTTSASILQFATYKPYSFGLQTSAPFQYATIDKPRHAAPVTVNENGTAIPYGASKREWLDTVTAQAVEHYGFKIVFENLDANVAVDNYMGYVEVFPTMYFRFKHTK